ncbi:MAG TPA: hypothetical protein VGD45_07220 [Steroidobacter sp.]|uniref:hypothetical protein n=1 Tax=Steroidobacter sp. TaxID=1978227 RepID=UPI002EDB8C8C
MNARTCWLGGLLAGWLAPLAVSAGPRVFEETARLPAPDATYTFPMSVAIDGDWLIATGQKEVVGEIFTQDNSAWLYQRQTNGSWTLVRRLLQHFSGADPDEPFLHVDMQGGVSAFLKEGASYIFERSGTNWVSVPSPIATDGMDVEVDAGTITVTAGRCAWATNSYRKNSNGAWVLARQTPAEPSPDCENEDLRGDVDVSGNAVIVATFFDGVNPPSARIFEGPFGTTPIMTRLVAPRGNPFAFGEPVAISLPAAVVGDSTPDIGPQAYTKDSASQWVRTGALLRPDNLALQTPSQIELRGGLAIVSQADDNAYGTRSGSISVFQRNTNGSFRYIAKLLASDRGPEQGFGFGAEISGRRVVATNLGTRAAYVFELPTDLTQPAAMQDNFEDGNAADWTPQAGGLFSVATTTTSRVYRQASTAGNATSLWNNTTRGNQAVEADIKPTAFSTTSGDKWFGVVARYTSPTNHYYITLRNNNTLSLRKIVNGAVTALASAPLTVTLNRSYRVRLEAIGTRLRVYVDNRLLLEASDRAHARGQAGVVTFRTRADFDNVLVSSNQHTTLATYRFGINDEGDSFSNWQSVGTWTRDAVAGVYRQTNTTASARSIAGIATDDQTVTARLRRIGSSGTSHWFGLAARYRDAGNYYYVSLRSNNTISLRKLVNNAITELDVAPFTVTTNTWYRVRLEVVRTHLRVYVNDVLRLDATDASHTQGRYGPVMFRSAAEYDEILAVQP